MELINRFGPIIEVLCLGMSDFLMVLGSKYGNSELIVIRNHDGRCRKALE